MSLSGLGKILGLDQARAWDRIAAYLWVPVILAVNAPQGCVVNALAELTGFAIFSAALLLAGSRGRHFVGAILSLTFLAPVLAAFIEFRFDSIWSTGLIFDLLPLPIYLVSVCGIARSVRRHKVANVQECATP